jgi:hypothetical protein
MNHPQVDTRTPARRTLDEQIAAEPPIAPLELPPDAASSPVEMHLARQQRRPVAIMGIVENGLIRPLDSAVKLTEHSHVIIVTSEAT